ncbi:unnamed protein product [Linum tenue]|uniref:Alanine--tRNA ligase n=1 Tax=Linum tenue TaxID=586396 RepID=A0AAV0PEU7_9ROSI|nr:unnamed protein product [Linum tenue]
MAGPPKLCSSIHGGKSLFPFPASSSSLLAKPIFPLNAYTGSALSTGGLSCRHGLWRRAGGLKCRATSTPASVQPVTDGVVVEDKSKENLVSGDSIRRRFIDFYASRGHKVLPSSSLVPDDPTVLLTIAGMLQFKPIFLGKAPREFPRATTSQKCIRTNDVENVGRTSRHHTFFEMLGNFSFGDYFKREAIKWAWELSIEEFGLPADSVWISIYEDDDETFKIWHEEDLGDDSRFIEFYNLVFMQYNRKDDGSLEPLKQQNIDTGLGLERLARILQKVPNNYETDLIYPIIQKASELANVPYHGADDKKKMQLKIIGDHMRAIVYLLSDGVLPSNVGRGYVARRLIRRAVRTGRLLGIKGDCKGNIEGAFLPAIAETVIEMSTSIDPEVKVRASRIIGELQREELRFVLTLERGEKLLEQMLSEALSSAKKIGRSSCLSGNDLFLLYDTYGFPVEITTEVAEEKGVEIDMEGFYVEMENQRRQSQAAHNVVKLDVENGGDLAEMVADTEFLGYDTLSTKAIVQSLLLNGKPVLQVSEGNEVEVLLNKTPFYAESGGQIGDRGYLYITEDQSERTAVVQIQDVKKSLGSVFVHKGTIKEGVLEVGKEVEANVDPKLRQRAKVHHTATHLLQSALKKVIGEETSQAGSLVAFDRLRFDFNFHRPLVDNELDEIERLINGWIGDATLLHTKVLPLTDAKKAGAIAMFGEKYGEEVRVVEVPGVSMELCGGTHVNNTSEIRAFKIISEQGIASGIRRIEAVAGEAYIEYINGRDSQLRRLCSTLKVKAEEVTTRVDNLLEELRAARNEVSTLRAKAAVYKASIIASKVVSIEASSPIRVLVENMDDVDAESLKSAAEYLVDSLQDPAAVVLGSTPDEGKVSLVAAFSPGVVKLGVQAGKFIGPIAKLCGGGGGGRPNFAQAGGRQPENLSSALEKARTDLLSVLTEKSKQVTSVEDLAATQITMKATENLVSGDSIRRRFIDFYASRGHKVLRSSSLVSDDPTVLLTIAGMLQFKPIFLGKVPRAFPRATTAQKCIRTNDVENVGRTSRHHTFFEMLGNFSFGDYFKREAIGWAWELSIEEFGLPADRVWISVYEDDDEAFKIWHEEDLEDDSRFLEFYNLVFMQYNRKDDGSLEPLKQQNIDTGLGLERLARILQKVPNNYETDLVYPIIQKASELAAVSYHDADDKKKMQLKIIGDHTRAIVYLLSDGVLPSNVGRGYVVRQLIRRAVRTGWLLGIKGNCKGNIEGAFLPAIAQTVIEMSTAIDPEVKARASRIIGELQREELRFVQTLERGEKLLELKLAEALSCAKQSERSPCLLGNDVFLLYATYGYPVEITTEVAIEKGVEIDREGFDIEMEEHRRQSQANHNIVKLGVENGGDLAEKVADTEFLGYDTLSTKAMVQSLFVNGKPMLQVSEGNEVEILLDKTPFYAESGGQIGDQGSLYVTGDQREWTAVVQIQDVKKSLGSVFVHKGTIKEGILEVGKEVEATVDPKLRQRAKVHHTATHLLQSALKKVIGEETSQAGSLVAFDRLRFDFNFHRPLVDGELDEIERLINGWIGDAILLQTKVLPMTDAKKAGAIAMFGEKYGEEVRVVEVPGVSMELCGGTHVNCTSEIRAFKIVSEQGIASGIRRIEAVAGEAYIEYTNGRDSQLRRLGSTLNVKTDEVTTRVGNLLKELQAARNEVSALRAKAAVYQASVISSKVVSIEASTPIRVLVENMDDVDAASLKVAAEYLVEKLQDPAAVVLGSAPDEGKVSLVAAFSPGVVKLGVQAGKFIGPMAKLCGGGGGGRPNFAQAGGRKPENLSSALEKARTDLLSVLTEKSGQ